MLALTSNQYTSAPDADITVLIDVSSIVVRLALRYVSEQRGWRVCAGSNERGACLTVADRHLLADPPLDVLVSRDTPSQCQAALDAVLNGSARAVVLWDEPNSLGPAVDALLQRSAVIPERVIQLALLAPRLSSRQQSTLRLVAMGRSNAEISASLNQSASTTKRDIADLLEIFDVDNRAALASTAGRLGYV